MSQFCVVIKIYNEFDMLEGCIQSLAFQELKPVQIIVADDGSPDPRVREEVNRLISKFPQLSIELLSLPLKTEPNLDTVGRTWREAWYKLKKNNHCNYFGMLDADTRLEKDYYQKLIEIMENELKFACVSGIFKIKSEEKDYTEQINIGAKVGRKDARGSGKVIRSSFIVEVESDFPEVDWDTWINTKAKVRGFKSPQIDYVVMYQERPTTRVAGKNHFRNGRLSYHFGYNPLLVLLKMILAKRGGLSILKGYFDARKKRWRLGDEEVRKYFGWRFFLHL